MAAVNGAVRRAGGREREPGAPRLGGPAIHHHNGSWGAQTGGGAERASSAGIVEKLFD